MASLQHSRVFKQGVEAWNEWREKSGEQNPDLRGTNASNLDLRGINLSGAQLFDCRFHNTNLSGGDLRNASIGSDDFSGAELVDAKLDGTYLGKVKLTSANLTGASFVGADMQHADFSASNLTGARFESAQLNFATFREARVEGANFRAADIRNQKLLEGVAGRAQTFYEAKINGELAEELQRNFPMLLDESSIRQGGYEQSYYGRVRALTGSDIKLIHLGARAIVKDDDDRILLVKRSDNGDWVMPAGGMEIGESILECCIREVKEESGLDVLSAVPIKIESSPEYDFVTSYGDPYQTFRVVFLVTEWTGELVKQTDETVDAGFFPTDDLPPVPDIYHETLEDLRNFDGTVILK